MARCDCGPMFPKSKVHKCPLLCKGDSGPNGPLLLWSNIPKDRVHVSFIVQRRQRVQFWSNLVKLMVKCSKITQQLASIINLKK